MSKWATRAFVTAGVAYAVMIGRPVDAEAQMAVACVNCSTVIQQLIGYAKQLEEAETQYQQYSTQLQQLANMTQNTATLPNTIFSSAMADMNAVQQLMSTGSQLSFTNTGASMGTFSSYLATASNVPPSTASQSALYSQWATRSKDGITAAMAAISAQNGQLASDNATMTGLQSQTMSETGQMQALQNVAEIAAQGVRETEKLRQLIMVLIQLEANKQQNASEEKASAQAQTAALGAVTPLNLNTGAYPQQ
jgi:P-type conjugative transfer protein TrbJ